MPCEPADQPWWPDQPDQLDLPWAFRQLQREAPPPDGGASCASPTPLWQTAGDCSAPASPPADDRWLADPSRRPSPPADNGPVSCRRDPTDRPPTPSEPLAEAALARRFARRWWSQVSSRRQRHVSAPEPDGDTEWTLLESDGLGPGPESVPMVRQFQRPAALRQAMAALQQRGRSAICRLAAAGRQRTRRTAAAWSVGPIDVGPVEEAVHCSRLLSPESGLPLFMSVSCDNLAEADQVRGGEGGGEGGSGAGDGTPPPAYPDCDPPPPYSLAVTRPTPAERLLWHGLDADQIATGTQLTPAERVLGTEPSAPLRVTPSAAERALWGAPSSTRSGSLSQSPS